MAWWAASSVRCCAQRCWRAPIRSLLALGLALAPFGIQLCLNAIRHYRRFGPVLGRDFVATGADAAARLDRSGRPFLITTVSRSLGHFVVRFGAQERRLANMPLFLIGAGVGIVSSSLGVGGGFLLVPIFAAAFRLPLYVRVAATIPYTIALSSAGIVSFAAVLPLFGTAPIGPEWSWAFFAAAGGVFGSWWAAKTQTYVPEHVLNLMLGGLTAAAGLLYVLSYVVPLPFRL